MKFKIKDNNVYFWVRVFDTKEELIEWAKKFDKKRNCLEDDAHYTEAEALTQKWERIIDDETQPHIGNILLHKKYLRPAILIHELAHASWWAYDVQYEKQSINTIEDEERLCYLVSDFWLQANTKMHKYGLW